jgi:hypothetical protein
VRWREYEQAMTGKSAVRFSKGSRWNNLSFGCAALRFLLWPLRGTHCLVGSRLCGRI